MIFWFSYIDFFPRCFLVSFKFLVSFYIFWFTFFLQFLVSFQRFCFGFFLNNYFDLEIIKHLALILPKNLVSLSLLVRFDTKKVQLLFFSINSSHYSLHNPILGSTQNVTDIVEDYFRKGYAYLEMLEFLKVYHKKNN